MTTTTEAISYVVEQRDSPVHGTPWVVRIVGGFHDGWSAGAFATEAEAEAERAVRERLDRLEREIPAAIDRPTYERLCADLGAPVREDRVIPGMVEHGMGGYTGMADADGTYRVFRLLTVRRGAGIAAERAARPGPARPVVARDEVACPNCGTLVARSLLMSASLGTACPDCFDELSG